MNDNLQGVVLPPCPFPGIEPFSYAEQAVFFARPKEVRKLVQLVVTYRGVLLYSESGTGKSSLINAGLIPRAINDEKLQPERIRVQLRRGEEFIIERIAVSAREKILLPSIFTEGISEEKVVLSAEEFLRKVEVGAQTAYPLLIFDQFEEWATLLETRASNANEIECQKIILNVITDIINNTTLRVKVLLSLREDYVTKLDTFFNLCPQLPDTYLRLTPLDADQLLRIIRGPYDAYPGFYKPEISAELAKIIQTDFLKRATAEGIHLSEVQIVCRDLFFYGKDGITPDSYYTLHDGIQGILEQFLERAISSLPEQQHVPAVNILSRMVTQAGTRNVISQNDLLSRVEVEENIDRELLSNTLTNLERKTKLVVSELRREVKYYQIVSEFLIDWIRKKARQLREQRLRKIQDELEIQKKKAEANDHKARKMRDLAYASISIFIILLVLSIFWILQQKKVMDYMNASLSTIKNAPERSLDNAADAVRAASVLSETYKKPARNLLNKALTSSLTRRTLFDYHATQNAIAFSPNGALLASGDGNGVIRFWNSRNGKEIGAIYQVFSITALLFISDSILAVGSDDGPIYLWNTNSFEKIKVLSGHIDAIWSLAFCPKRNMLVSTSVDCSAKLWDLSNNYSVYTLLGHFGSVNSAAFSPDGLKLATAGSDSSIKIWNIDTRNQIADITGDKDEIFSIAFSPDNKFLASGEMGGKIKVWDALLGHLETSIEPFSNSINNLFFSPDDRQIAASGYDGAVHIWEANTWRELAVFSSPLHKAFYFAYDPTGQIIASAGENSIKIWSTKIGEDISTFPAHNGFRVNCVVYNKDMKYFASAGDNDTTILWDAKKFSRQSKSFPGHLVVFSPIDSNLMVTGRDSTIFLWDLTNNTVKRELKSHHGRLAKIAFSPDGRRAASMSLDTTLIIWDNNWNIIKTFHGETQEKYKLNPTDVVFSADGDKIIITGEKGDLIIIDAAWKSKILAAHASHVLSIAYSKNKECLITGGIDKYVYMWIWDKKDQNYKIKPGMLFSDHTNAVNDVESDYNEKMFASASSDRTIKVYDIKNGHMRLNIEDCPYEINCISFSPDGNWLLAGDYDGWVRLYALNNDTVLAKVQQRLASTDADTLLSFVWEKTNDLHKEMALINQAKKKDTSLNFKTDEYIKKFNAAKNYYLIWNRVYTGGEDTVTKYKDKIVSILGNLAQMKIDTTNILQNILYQREMALGKNNIKNEQKDSAIKHFEKAKRYSISENFDPKKLADLLIARQILQNAYQEDSLKAAVDSLKKVIKLDPAFLTAVEGLGDWYSNDSLKYDSAIIAYKKVNQEYPSPLITAKLANIYYLKKQYSEARYYAMQALRMNSDCDLANLILGEVEFDQKRNEKALLALSQVTMRNKLIYSQALMLKGLIFSERLFMYEETYKAYHEAVEWFPQGSQYLINFAEASLLTNRFEEAIQISNKIINEPYVDHDSVVPKLDMRFVKIASLLCTKDHKNAMLAIEDFCSYYNNFPNYSPPITWSWVGVQHRINQWNIDNEQRTLLNQLIKYIRTPGTKIDCKTMIKYVQPIRSL